MMCNAGLKVGTTGTSGAWMGVIRRGNEVVYTCNHPHPNKYQHSTFKTGALNCIQDQVFLARRPEARQFKASGYVASMDFDAINSVISDEPVAGMGWRFEEGIFQ